MLILKIDILEFIEKKKYFKQLKKKKCNCENTTQ